MSIGHEGMSEERSLLIAAVFADCFGDLASRHPGAFRTKFRKMAASAVAFYRGSSCLFYADLAGHSDGFAVGDASRVWIHGDLHAENFGTYMTGAGALVFDVNDFDEAFVGPFTWDVRRMAVSLALLAYGKAASDDELRTLVTAAVVAYADQIEAFASSTDPGSFVLTRQTTNGTIKELLSATSLRTRAGLLARPHHAVKPRRGGYVGECGDGLQAV